MVLLSGSWCFHFWFRIESWWLHSYVLSLVHGSFPFWTLLCGVYRPYGLIFFTNFIIVVLLRSVLEMPILQCTSELRTGHRRLCHVRVCAAPGEAFNILWYVFANSPCYIVNECINVSRFIWIGHVYFRGVHHHLMDALTYGNCFEDS